MNYGKSNNNDKGINEKDILQWTQQLKRHGRKERNSQNTTNFELKVPIKIVLLIAPLVTRSFSVFWGRNSRERFFY